MDKDIIWFAENMCGLNLTENHKEILLAFQEAKDRGQKIFINCGRIQGKGGVFPRYSEAAASDPSGVVKDEFNQRMRQNLCPCTGRENTAQFVDT